MSDERPADCRFRLQDEGKAYPRSSCTACGASIGKGLGTSCSRVVPNHRDEALAALVEQAFRDGLAYATIVDVKDPDEAWRTSRIRSQLAAIRTPEAS